MQRVTFLLRIAAEGGPKLAMTCSWPSGVRIHINCFIPPTPNVLAIEWKVEGWTPQTRTGNGVSPVWFSLYRWADPTVQAFGARFFGDYRHDTFRVSSDPKASPLPPPSVKQDNGFSYIEQTFPPDGLFPDGFRYAITPFAPGMAIHSVDMTPTGEARLHIMPVADKLEGRLVVVVTTSSDKGGPIEELRRVAAPLQENAGETIAGWQEETRKKAAEFWSKSRVQIADPVLENLWYETLYARRCTCRNDTVPPGLFLPSTVQDYSHWHGDYHTNYNIQEPYWGDYTANHFELGDAYFKAIEFFLPIGRVWQIDQGSGPPHRRGRLYVRQEVNGAVEVGGRAEFVACGTLLHEAREGGK